MRRILLVDDQAENFAEAYELMFPEDRLALASSGGEALRVLAEDHAFDVVLLDVRMPAQYAASDEEEGLAVLSLLQEERPELPVILVSVISDVETVVRGMRLGAFYYVQKPPDPKKLRHLVDRAIDQGRAAAAQRALKASINVRDRIEETSEKAPARDRLGSLVGATAPMLAIYQRLERAAASDATVLVLGESGTGKELAAREIHRLSGRAKGPFRVVNCPALPRDLLESTLFGHRKGAFTGAHADRQGEFELAHEGTLLLDEVGEMDLDLQAKLLRVLEEGEVHAVGARDPKAVNVRIVAATNRDLRQEVAKGAFREDFYYRLNVIRAVMPPLRDRKEDLALLSGELLAKVAGGGEPPRLTDQAVARLASHGWPGNVRELRNVLERAAAMADGSSIDADLIEVDEGGAPAAAVASDPAEAVFAEALAGRPFDGSIRAFRDRHGEEALRDLLERALRWTADIKEAGRLLGFVGRDDAQREYDNLRQWMRKLGISKKTVLAGGAP